MIEIRELRHVNGGLKYDYTLGEVGELGTGSI